MEKMSLFVWLIFAVAFVKGGHLPSHKIESLDPEDARELISLVEEFLEKTTDKKSLEETEANITETNFTEKVCNVSDWGPWTECSLAKSCDSSYVLPPYTTYGMSWSVPQRLWDTGRENMEVFMHHKEHLYVETGECRNNGSCPELLSKPSDSFHLCTNGTAGDIPCRNADMLSFISTDDLGFDEPLPKDNLIRVNEIWGWFDPLTGDEYAIVGVTPGTSFVRITDPTRPLVVAVLPTHDNDSYGGFLSMWRDIKIIGHYAYIVSELSNHGLQVFDLRRLRGITSLQNMTADAHYDKFGNAHNVVANPETGFLYVVGCGLQPWTTPNPNYTICDGGLHVVDVRDPLNPMFAGCYKEDGYTHDAQCVVYRGPDKRYEKHEICFCFNEDSLTIVDVTDKDNMEMVSKRTYNGVKYSHQGALTEDWTSLLLDDEGDEYASEDKHTKTYFWDIRDLQNPEMRGRYVSSERAIDHNQYIVGNLTFQANYEAGLRILYVDINAEENKYNLIEQAYFDAFPASTEAEFRGVWGVYPYLPSRNVVISVIEYGVYIVRPNYRAMEAERRDMAFGERKRMRHVVTNENNAVCPHLVESETCVPNVRC